MRCGQRKLHVGHQGAAPVGGGICGIRFPRPSVAVLSLLLRLLLLLLLLLVLLLMQSAATVAAAELVSAVRGCW